MNKTEFTREFAGKAGLTIKDAREVLKVLGDEIATHMKDEDGVSPFNGVKFIAIHKDARDYRNPRTGDVVTAPAKYVPKARFGKAFKEAVK